MKQHFSKNLLLLSFLLLFGTRFCLANNSDGDMSDNYEAPKYQTPQDNGESPRDYQRLNDEHSNNQSGPMSNGVPSEVPIMDENENQNGRFDSNPFGGTQMGRDEYPRYQGRKEPQAKNMRFFLIACAVVFVVGGGTVLYRYWKKQPAVLPKKVDNNPTTQVQAEQSALVEPVAAPSIADLSLRKTIPKSHRASGGVSPPF